MDKFSLGSAKQKHWMSRIIASRGNIISQQHFLSKISVQGTGLLILAIKLGTHSKVRTSSKVYTMCYVNNKKCIWSFYLYLDLDVDQNTHI